MSRMVSKGLGRSDADSWAVNDSLSEGQRRVKLRSLMLTVQSVDER
jgi:hypothetical protein